MGKRSIAAGEIKVSEVLIVSAKVGEGKRNVYEDCCWWASRVRLYKDRRRRLWVWFSCESKSSIDEGDVITESRFSVLNEQPDDGHYTDEQEQDCVVYDEITDGRQGWLLETTDAATEIRQESLYVGSKQLQQCRKEEHVILEWEPLDTKGFKSWRSVGWGNY